MERLEGKKKLLTEMVFIFSLCFSVCCKFSIMNTYYFFVIKKTPNVKHFYDVLLAFRSVLKIYPLKPWSLIRDSCYGVIQYLHEYLALPLHFVRTNPHYIDTLGNLFSDLNSGARTKLCSTFEYYTNNNFCTKVIKGGELLLKLLKDEM